MSQFYGAGDLFPVQGLIGADGGDVAQYAVRFTCGQRGLFYLIRLRRGHCKLFHRPLGVLQTRFNGGSLTTAEAQRPGVEYTEPGPGTHQIVGQ